MRLQGVLAIATLIVAVLGIIGGARSVQAHGYLVRSIPQDQAVISRAPSRAQLWFSEPLEPKFSTIAVYDQNGKEVDAGDGMVAPEDHERLSVRLPANLPDGAYVVRFRIAFASDGHVVPDQIVFWVGQRTGSGSVPGAAQTADPFEVVARSLSLVGALTAFGTALIFCLALRPAWHNRAYPQGGLAPRIMTTLYRLVGATLAIALIGHGLWLIQQSEALFGANLSQVLTQDLWSVTATSTTFGGVWQLRVLLLLGVGVSVGAALWISSRRPEWVFPLWIVGTVMGGLALAGFSLGSHAAGSTLWTPITVLADWLHLLANGTWIGGLIALIVALRAALLPLDSEGRRMAILAVLRRFSPVAVGAVLMIIVTGAYSAFATIYTPAQTMDTSYGLTLSAKLILVAPLLVLGFLHNRALLPTRFKAAERWIERTLRIEAVLGVCVILVAALLSATPPPAPPNARAAANLPSYTASAGSLALTLTLNPGGIGANAYDVQVMQAGQPLTSGNVAVTFVDPAQGIQATRLALDPAGDGLFSGAGEEIDSAGKWQALFDVQIPGTPEPTRIALIFPVTNEANALVIRQPSALNWLSLLTLIALAIGGILLLARRSRRIAALRQRLDPLSVMVGIGALILTIIVLGGSTLFLAQASLTYQTLSNATPVYVNPVLPDQQSIDAGKRLYAANCAACHTASSGENGISLTPTISAAFSVEGYVKAHDDSALYSFLLGSRTHPFGQNLNINERWTLLNYLRAYAEQPTATPTPTSVQTTYF